MFFEFDRVRALVKTAKSYYFFKSLAPYIEKEMRYVGEVPTHKFESLRSLIMNGGILSNMVNVVEKTFKIHLLQLEISVSFFLSLNLT